MKLKVILFLIIVNIDDHHYFCVLQSAFEGQPFQYPLRNVKHDDNDMKVPPAAPNASATTQGQAGTSHGGVVVGARGKHGHSGKDEGGRNSKRARGEAR